MYVQGVRLENVRGFHDARCVNLDLTRPDGTFAGWTVLAGRNGSGKTSLLRAVALAIGGPFLARVLIPDFTEWVSKGKPDAAVEVRLVPDPEYDSDPGLGVADEPFSAGLWWRLPGEAGRQPSLHESPASPRFDAARQDLWLDDPIGWFFAAYGPFRRLAGGSGEGQRLAVRRGPAARVATLFHEDASLSEGVSWLIEQHLRALERRAGAARLKKLALAVLGDGLLPDGYLIQDVDSEGLWVERDGERFPLREMSDGYRAVAALVVDLLKQLSEAYGELPVDSLTSTVVTAPGVVIIDEVDAHLHLSWQRRIGGWMKEHFPRIQFIVTTHSPYVCQAADANGLIHLPGPDEDDSPRILDAEAYERIMRGDGDEELFGLDTPYSDQAARLRKEFTELEARVFTDRADEQAVRRFQELRKLLER